MWTSLSASEDDFSFPVLRLRIPFIISRRRGHTAASVPHAAPIISIHLYPARATGPSAACLIGDHRLNPSICSPLNGIAAANPGGLEDTCQCITRVRFDHLRLLPRGPSPDIWLTALPMGLSARSIFRGGSLARAHEHLLTWVPMGFQSLATLTSGWQRST
jgi:hypothetical protein